MSRTTTSMHCSTIEPFKAMLTLSSSRYGVLACVCRNSWRIQAIGKPHLTAASTPLLIGTRFKERQPKKRGPRRPVAPSNSNEKKLQQCLLKGMLLLYDLEQFDAPRCQIVQTRGRARRCCSGDSWQPPTPVPKLRRRRQENSSMQHTAKGPIRTDNNVLIGYVAMATINTETRTA
jgi:hypothetical protein